MPAVLITGASRGIGLGLTREFAARGWDVIATCRNPDNAAELRALAADNGRVAIAPLDVRDFAAIDELAASLKGRAIDVLVNNAGISKRCAFGELDYDAWREVLDTNLLAPMKLAESLIDNLVMSGNGRIVNLASSLGSISATTGGSYFYRSSKAALNMAMRSLAHDLRPRGVIVALLSPGFVDTDFTRSATRVPKISVEESARGLTNAIEALTPEQSGAFLRFTGERIDW